MEGRAVFFFFAAHEPKILWPCVVVVLEVGSQCRKGKERMDWSCFLTLSTRPAEFCTFWSV